MNPSVEIIEFYSEQLKIYSGNPSSKHDLGQNARKAQDKALISLSEKFSCRADEIIITSGGTESINLAVKGSLEANPRFGRRVLITAGEHAAVEKTCKWLASNGYEIGIIPLSREGTANLQILEEMLAEPCALLNIIHVNNETGAVNNIEEIVKLKNKIQPNIMVHVDGVQATGKIDWSFSGMGADFYSGSGHKFGAPRGIGWLIHRKGKKLAAQIHGGGQQHALRSGTENVPLLITLDEAVRQAVENLSESNRYVLHLKALFLESLDELGVSYFLISPPAAVPGIINIAFKGLRGETLLHALSDKGIYISTGSACSSKSKSDSKVLKAMGIDTDIARSSVRISLSRHETENDIIETARQIAAVTRWLARN
jgi:cysteine desulfurase